MHKVVVSEKEAAERAKDANIAWNKWLSKRGMTRPEAYIRDLVEHAGTLDTGTTLFGYDITALKLGFMLGVESRGPAANDEDVRKLLDLFQSLRAYLRNAPMSYHSVMLAEKLHALVPLDKLEKIVLPSTT